MGKMEYRDDILVRVSSDFKQNVLLSSAGMGTLIDSVLNSKYDDLLAHGGLYRFENMVIMLSNLMGTVDSVTFESCVALLNGTNKLWSAFENKYMDYYLLYQQTLV